MTKSIMVGFAGAGPVFSKKHKCFDCGFSFDTADELEAHVRVIHDGKPKFNPEVWDKFKSEEREAKDNEYAEAHKPVTRQIGILLPGEIYSANKKQIKDFIKVHCSKWTGAGWVGDKVSVEATFKKTMEKLGMEYDYDGDQLWISGEVELMRGLIEFSKSIGATTIEK